MAETANQLLGSVEGKQVSTRELLSRNFQELVEEVNAKRKRDSTLLTGRSESDIKSPSLFVTTTHAQMTSALSHN